MVLETKRPDFFFLVSELWLPAAWSIEDQMPAVEMPFPQFPEPTQGTCTAARAHHLVGVDGPSPVLALFCPTECLKIWSRPSRWPFSQSPDPA